jgi:hypothetical protein
MREVRAFRDVAKAIAMAAADHAMDMRRPWDHGMEVDAPA